MKKIIMIMFLLFVTFGVDAAFAPTGPMLAAFKPTALMLGTRIFSSLRYPLRDIMIKAIENETKIIDVLVYLMTTKGIANHLILAKARGVEVNVAVDVESFERYDSVLRKLRSEGIEPIICHKKKGIMHKKVLLCHDTNFTVDRTRFKGSVALVGSLNQTEAGLDVNDENLVITDHAAAFIDAQKDCMETMLHYKHVLSDYEHIKDLKAKLAR